MNGHDWMDSYTEEELMKIDETSYARERFDEMYGDINWKQIDGHPSYRVSDTGLIASFKKRFPRILSTWKNQYGHRYIRLEGEDYSVHRLVAKHFVDNPENYSVVRHLDDNPNNNNVKNLAWGTQKDNRMDCVNHGRDFVKSVYCYETDRIYRSCADAAYDLGVTRGAITMCCQGKIHECAGHHLCYLSDKEKRMSNLDDWLNHSPYKPVKATNLKTGEVIIFPSRKRAAEELGIPDCGISSTISGRTQHSHYWRFENYG